MSPSPAAKSAQDNSNPQVCTRHRDASAVPRQLQAEARGGRMRRWRLALKARLPFVRRRELDKADQRLTALVEDILLRSCACDAVAISALRTTPGPFSDEVCLFVTCPSNAALKRHVTTHIEHLLDAGIEVILIINTDLPAAAIQIHDALRDRLAAVLVRANSGYDFAAWAHAWKLTGGLPGCKRLYLINDSIVGPLDTGNFKRIIHRVRASPTDLVGLTDSPNFRFHLQSYFLVVQGSALRSEVFDRFFGNLLCLPTKEHVILLYETRFTAIMQAHGMRCEALFCGPQGVGYTPSDVVHLWSELILDGFPYIKTSVLKSEAADPRLPTLVPQVFRDTDF